MSIYQRFILIDQGCIHEGNTGLCYGPDDLIPKALGLVPTTTFCDTAEQCQCYISESPCASKFNHILSVYLSKLSRVDCGNFYHNRYIFCQHIKGFF